MCAARMMDAAPCVISEPWPPAAGDRTQRSERVTRWSSHGLATRRSGIERVGKGEGRGPLLDAPTAAARPYRARRMSNKGAGAAQRRAVVRGVRADRRKGAAGDVPCRRHGLAEVHEDLLLPDRVRRCVVGPAGLAHMRGGVSVVRDGTPSGPARFGEREGHVAHRDKAHSWREGGETLSTKQLKTLELSGTACARASCGACCASTGLLFARCPPSLVYLARGWGKL